MAGENSNTSALEQQVANLRTLQASYDTLATNTTGLPTENYMKNLYAAHFETNNDGTDTYTMVMPLTATVDASGQNITITI